MKSLLHILIVDDSPEDRRLIRGSLATAQRRRYRFSEADTGEQGLSLCLSEQGTPDLLLLDQNLPDMTGQEVLCALARHNGQVPLPVVLLTGAADIGQAEAALAAGAQDFIEKSYLESRLLEQIIANSIERYRLHAALRSSEQQLQHALAAADAANRAKSEFLANISHEIRTPMTAILGYADILAGHLNDPDDAASVQIIQRNGRHLLTLINDLLDLSKIEAGGLALQKSKVELAGLLDEICALMWLQAQRKALGLNIVYRSQVPRIVLTDPIRLRQILINLIGNAIKFTAEGGVALEVRYQAERERLTLAVIDTGIGITPGEQARLFRPFTQGREGSARGGTGLGLAISQRLAALLDGEIVFKANPSCGSTFTLSLPAAAAAALISPSPQTRSAVSSAGPGLPALSGRVLVADDRADIRRLIQNFIEQSGARTVGVADGAAAVAAVTAADLPFDAVVMDMNMPLMDGYQATRKLRSAGYRQPIIALTASAMSGQLERCLRAGCDAFLSKPVSAQMLIETLHRQLENRRRYADVERPSVLLVEDNDDARAATMRLLHMVGYRVSAVADAGAALELARRSRPSVVLLDLQLPDMDGYDLARQLRHSLGDTPVLVALSGQAQDLDRARAAGLDHHLLKPAGLQTLLAVMPPAGAPI